MRKSNRTGRPTSEHICFNVCPSMSRSAAWIEMVAVWFRAHPAMIGLTRICSGSLFGFGPLTTPV